MDQKCIGRLVNDLTIETNLRLAYRHRHCDLFFRVATLGFAMERKARKYNKNSGTLKMETGDEWKN